jgi:hypothetical protein
MSVYGFNEAPNKSAFEPCLCFDKLSTNDLFVPLRHNPFALSQIFPFVRSRIFRQAQGERGALGLGTEYFPSY